MSTTQSENSFPANPLIDEKAIEDTVARIRQLNEKVLASAKEAGEASLQAYEKAVQRLVEFEENVASASQLEWVAALANTHAKFVQDVTGSFVDATRTLLK